MRQEIQSSSGEAQQSSPITMGKFQTTETISQTLSHSTHPSQGIDVSEMPSYPERIGKVADKSRCTPSGNGNIAVHGVIFLIRIYQIFISPWFRGCCRFTPSCSNYSIEAFRVHGFWKGCFLTIWRLMRCQPFCRGGYDPVPSPHSSDLKK